MTENMSTNHNTLPQEEKAIITQKAKDKEYFCKNEFIKRII